MTYQRRSAGVIEGPVVSIDMDQRVVTVDDVHRSVVRVHLGRLGDHPSLFGIEAATRMSIGVRHDGWRLEAFSLRHDGMRLPDESESAAIEIAAGLVWSRITILAAELGSRHREEAASELSVLAHRGRALACALDAVSAAPTRRARIDAYALWLDVGHELNASMERHRLQLHLANNREMMPLIDEESLVLRPLNAAHHHIDRSHPRGRPFSVLKHIAAREAQLRSAAGDAERDR